MRVPREKLPPPGSILKRRLHAGELMQPVTGRVFDHLGIYAGRRRVIHFTGESKKDKEIRIRITSLQRFLEGENLRVHRTPANRDHAKAIVGEASRFINKRFRGKEYHIVTNNCERFALHCYTVEYTTARRGPKRREGGWLTQARKAVVVVATVVGGPATGVVAATVGRKRPF